MFGIGCGVMRTLSHCIYRIPTVTPSPSQARVFEITPSFLLQPCRHRYTDTERAFLQNRAQRGLFAGKQIRFGNQVSHSHRKHRRPFKPNVQRAHLWSDILQTKIHVNVTAHALRCIDKAGGIDRFILKTKKDRLGIRGTEFGLQLRERLRLVLAERRKVRQLDEQIAMTQQVTSSTADSHTQSA